jgi:two-component system alkaline phosphatase synthesis response regulator PhoP/two-component system response regulator VicR
MAKILVVDDERYIVRLVQVNLERAGYEVAIALDGLEALEKVKQERPDIVLLDVMMPRLDGWETLKRLRMEPETVELPVVMLTAKGQNQDVFQGYQLGCDLYLTKPFSPLELLTFIKRILSSRDDDDAAEGKVYQIG